MNRIFYSLIVSCVIVFSAHAQKDETLLTIGKTNISKAEFERIYKKNNSNLFSEADKKSPKDYLDLFIDFKLKVIEAENLKMDTANAFKKELAGYRKELAQPYLTDVKYDQKLVKELYNRMTKEVNASHILFVVKPGASDQEVEDARKKAEKVRQEILNGKDFNEAAKEYSDDPSAKTNGGKLGYFTAFQMVAPFEDAAYNTPVGEISEPVRSSFGFHLIKVNDIRDNRGEIKVAHIMKMFPKGANENDRASLKTEIDSIYTALQNGADFAELAKKYSDDKRTASNGGEMPWFSERQIIPEFTGPAFALKNVGDYTHPIETAYGYHIIKKLDSRPVKPFDEVKNDIEEKIKKDPERSTTSKKLFIDELKKEYNFRGNDKNLEKLKGKNIGEEATNENLKLFTIDKKTYTLSEFNQFLKNKNFQKGNYLSHYEDWVETEITNLENSKLEEKYPEFRYLMQEYHDGILLFNISQDKIWNFASQDSVGLQKFYEKNKKKYNWGERFKGYIVMCKDRDSREEAEKYFAAGIPADEIADRLNKNRERVTITEGAWEKGSQPIVDYFVWNGPEPKYFNSEVTFIRGDKIPPEPKNLEDARGLYISDYQNYLEKKWVKELRNKYKIKVNKKLLNSIPSV
ncbi:MAG TPA: peptidylprolyl isomerase [Draconibacterium sp.]|nr:peptidylprolyl isomerase [Draconibacterium sp.]